MTMTMPLERAPSTARTQSRSSAGELWGWLSAGAGLAGLVAVVALPGLASIHHASPAAGLSRFVACMSGSLALALMGLATLGGIAMRAGLPAGVARRFGRATLTQAHLYVAAGATVLTVMHLAGVFVVPELGIGWLQLLLPFTRAGGSASVIAHGFAVIAVYLLVAVIITTALRRRLSWPVWKRVHLLTGPLFTLAVAHTVLVETWGSRWLLPSALSASALVVSVPLLRARIPNLATAATAGGRAGDAPAIAAVSPPTPPAGAMPLVISQMTWEAQDIMSLRLTDPRRGALPAWTPGAHLEVALPSGRLRYYSIYGDPADRSCYQIAVLRQDTGRGGSREMHEALRIGRPLLVSPPRNTFPLRPASSYLFIAGGIGITAVLPMARVAANRGARWWLLYVGKSRSRMALLTQAVELGPSRVLIHSADLSGRPNLASLIPRLPAGCAVYCCGPNGMVDELTTLISARPELSLHVERFGGASSTSGGGAAVRLELRRSGQTLEVGGEQSLLDAVSELAPQLTGGCGQGVCGRCKATVLGGEPDHRDQLLSPAEHDDGQMLLCVSRAHSDHLVLDL